MAQDRPPRAALAALRHALARFWATAPGALKYHLNTDELTRITVTSLSAGGGLFGLVEALNLGATTLFPASGDAALATAVLTMILEIRRRLAQGTEITPHPLPPARRERPAPRRGPAGLEGDELTEPGGTHAYDD